MDFWDSITNWFDGLSGSDILKGAGGIATAAGALSPLFTSDEERRAAQTPQYRPVGEALGDIDKVREWMASNTSPITIPTRRLTSNEMNDPVFAPQAVGYLQQIADEQRKYAPVMGAGGGNGMMINGQKLTENGGNLMSREQWTKMQPMVNYGGKPPTYEEYVANFNNKAQGTVASPQQIESEAAPAYDGREAALRALLGGGMPSMYQTTNSMNKLNMLDRVKQLNGTKNRFSGEEVNLDDFLNGQLQMQNSGAMNELFSQANPEFNAGLQKQATSAHAASYDPRTDMIGKLAQIAKPFLVGAVLGPGIGASLGAAGVGATAANLGSKVLTSLVNQGTR